MLDPRRPYAYLAEREPNRNVPGQLSIANVSTVFLTASRCPIGCTMCDLHQNTLPHPTAMGDIERQIQFAQQRLPASNWLKLYNSGNFFDPSSIPIADYGAICQTCNPYERIVIENHPRFGLNRHQPFRDALNGQLEIAVGLESVQPRLLGQLNKQMTRDDFDRYARQLSQWQIDLRVFLIIGAPGLGISESLRWTRMSVKHAVAAKARHISLIPARSGHGWNGQSDRLPKFELTELADLLGDCFCDMDNRSCLSLDLWDVQTDSLDENETEQLKRIQDAVLHQDSAKL